MPLSQRGDPVPLEHFATVKVTVEVKVVVQGGVDGGEFLQRINCL
jgi:hypothetical protein